jgi:hypothetical protein
VCHSLGTKMVDLRKGQSPEGIWGTTSEELYMWRQQNSWSVLSGCSYVSRWTCRDRRRRSFGAGASGKLLWPLVL